MYKMVLISIFFLCSNAIAQNCQNLDELGDSELIHCLKNMVRNNANKISSTNEKLEKLSKNQLDQVNKFENEQVRSSNYKKYANFEIKKLREHLKDNKLCYLWSDAIDPWHKCPYGGSYRGGINSIGAWAGMGRYERWYAKAKFAWLCCKTLED